ncbi:MULTISPECIES: NnrS family protein [Bartonella]|uniref:Uncharacterized protein involved in response to NO n=1 Tax=Bartonella choladocola TaxID=2750995 RepID=A0A1U9MF76_9HYPH|nr:MULTISPECIES: NnrS family protein [Bartonella]AQT46506.1 uncharacterized protein involved in response to NO [Bartonella choladocola]MBH9974472.1 NnrS family protein [Bartonella choladocola]MBI0014079.1 NnrS family protein [Bartonella sp. B10834G3]
MGLGKKIRAVIAHSPFFIEGVFLFFPVSACYAVLMPFIWVIVYQLDYPGTRYIFPQQWHAHEMIFGFYSAALAGFLCSAVAEWTETKPLNGMRLFRLFLLWLPGRIVGFFGSDYLMITGSLFDCAFLALLIAYVGLPIILKKKWKSISFLLWLLILFILETTLKISWWQEETELSSRLLWAIISVFVVLFSLAISRINTVVTNLSLDPSGETSPYRPHPGRRNLSPFLTVLYALSMLFLPSSQMQYYLAFAASAGFMDRTAEWFIGKAAFKAEVLCLALANTSAGVGFFLIGLSGFNESISIYAGLHILTIVTLGLGVLGVFTIAGLRHSGRKLIAVPWQSKAAIAFIIFAAASRVLPETSSAFAFINSHYAVAATLWSVAFLLWLWGYLPILGHPVKVSFPE